MNRKLRLTGLSKPILGSVEVDAYFIGARSKVTEGRVDTEERADVRLVEVSSDL